MRSDLAGGRMSRQRKRDAVLWLLRGEDLESVSRGLGVTAATLSGRRDAFLAAGEASLSTRPLDAEALESGRLKAKLGEMLLEREVLETKVAALEARGPGPFWPAGGRSHEPDRLAGQRQRRTPAVKAAVVLPMGFQAAIDLG